MSCQYKFILEENDPFIITMKWVKYIQKDTLAKGEKNGWPKMNFAGSFLQPNIAANMHK